MSYDAPNYAAGAAVGWMVLAPVAWLVAAAVWARVEPLVAPAFAARVWPVLNAPVPVPAVAARLAAWGVAAAWAVRVAPRRAVGWGVAVVCARSEWAFRRVCAARAEKAVYSGLTRYEEWAREVESLPREARLALRGEIRRYRPSERLVMRARRLAGRSCAEVRAAEMARLNEKGK